MPHVLDLTDITDLLFSVSNVFYRQFCFIFTKKEKKVRVVNTVDRLFRIRIIYLY